MNCWTPDIRKQMETDRILTKTNRKSFSKPSGAKDQAKNPLAKEATVLTPYVLLVVHTYVYIYVTIHLESVCIDCSGLPMLLCSCVCL